jgi:hypothetical protein
MRFGTWNSRSLYRSGSLKSVSREFPKYKLDLVTVQKVGWDKVTLNQQTIIQSSMEMGMLIITHGQIFFVYKGTISEAKRVESVSDRMTKTIILGGCWFDIILNVHAPTEDKINVMLKDSFYEELKRVLDQF